MVQRQDPGYQLWVLGGGELRRDIVCVSVCVFVCMCMCVCVGWTLLHVCSGRAQWGMLVRAVGWYWVPPFHP